MIQLKGVVHLTLKKTNRVASSRVSKFMHLFQKNIKGLQPSKPKQFLVFPGMKPRVSRNKHEYQTSQLYNLIVRLGVTTL